MRVLYDGWPLAREPGSPGALHLLELLEARPDWVEPWLALPGAVDPALLPGSIRIAEERGEGTPIEGSSAGYSSASGSSAGDSPAGRLRWEQLTLPSLARRTGARLLHVTHLFPPLASPAPVLLSPVDAWAADSSATRGTVRPGLLSRLREALGRGGLAGIHALLWPVDLPLPPVSLPIRRLPPLVHPAFLRAQPPLAGVAPNAGPSEPFILCPGPLDDGALEQLAAAWSWVAAGLGEEWALAVSDLTDRQAAHLRELCAQRNIPLNLVPVCLHHPAQRAALFQRAGVVLALAPARPWGDPLLYALAGARPLAGWETAAAGQRVGPAGYLAPPGDTRALGAAVVTLAVEEEVAQALAQAAQARSVAWGQDGFKIALSQLYHQVIESRS